MPVETFLLQLAFIFLHMNINATNMQIHIPTGIRTPVEDSEMLINGTLF